MGMVRLLGEWVGMVGLMEGWVGVVGLLGGWVGVVGSLEGWVGWMGSMGGWVGEGIIRNRLVGRREVILGGLVRRVVGRKRKKVKIL